MGLKDYTTEELRAELKRRNAEEKAKTPSKITLGGQEVEIRNVERCDGNAVGECHLLEGYIEIADIYNKDRKQSESSKVNTFYHELTHCILQTMGENELNNNEKFVCCFAGFLTEAMCSSEYEKKEE